MASVAAVTDAQMKLLRLLNRAYEDDRAVRIAGRTTWESAEDNEPTAAHLTARKLVIEGFARYSEPSQAYLLLTPAGRALASPRTVT